MRLGSAVEQVENVRFGSLADKVKSQRHLRFTPNNGHWTAIQVSIFQGPEDGGRHLGGGGRI